MIPSFYVVNYFRVTFDVSFTFLTTLCFDCREGLHSTFPPVARRRDRWRRLNSLGVMRASLRRFGAKPFETRAGALVAVLCFRMRDAARSQHDSPNNSRSADPARDTARAQDEGVRRSVGSALSAVTATLKRASQALAFLLIPRCARAFSFSASLRPPC